jgi:phosphosulfolactate synthase
MINFPLTHIPNRAAKPRTQGLTMVMDKGLSLREVEDFLSISAEYVDVVKLGWGTSVVTPLLSQKLALYRKHDIPVYFGGTLMEIFFVRGMMKEYRKVLETYEVKYVEVSSGSVDIEQDEKCRIIKDLAQDFTVLSEVGSKNTGKIIAPYQWVEMMNQELEAGSWKVIAEARESGTVGMFRSDGEIRSDLIEEILHEIPGDRILWEAPQKTQQVWFIELLGSDVNLGNIPPQEVIPLETLRLGLRGDTFFTFLDQKEGQAGA